MTKYRDEEWLHEKYVEDGLSYDEIADLCGSGRRTIRKWVDRFNLGEWCCEDCGDCFRDEGGLNAHKSSVHSSSPESTDYRKPDWLQEKLEEGYTQKEIADLCGVEYNTIRKHVRENNLGTESCPVDGCNNRTPTEEGILQHLSRDHPDHPENSFGLHTEKVEGAWRDWVEEALENGIDRLTDEEYLNERLEMAREAYDPDEQSEFMKQRMAEVEDGEYPMQDPETVKKMLESREHSGPRNIEVEETGHHVASSWEKEVDLALHEAGIDYEYEPQTIELETGRYTPDFAVGQSVVEVKGELGYIWDPEKFDSIGEQMCSRDEEYIVIGSVDMPCDSWFSIEDIGEFIQHVS